MDTSTPSPIPFNYDSEDDIDIKSNRNHNNKHNHNRSKLKSSIQPKIEKNEKCHFCQKWCNDLKDFKQNFISCNYCIHSFHKSCILNASLFQSSLSFPQCSQIKYKLNPKHHYSCNDKKQNENTEKLIELIDDSKYETMNYVYNETNDPEYYNSKSKKIPDQIRHSQFKNQGKKLMHSQFNI